MKLFPLALASALLLAQPARSAEWETKTANDIALRTGQCEADYDALAIIQNMVSVNVLAYGRTTPDVKALTKLSKTFSEMGMAKVDQRKRLSHVFEQALTDLTNKVEVARLRKLEHASRLGTQRGIFAALANNGTDMPGATGMMIGIASDVTDCNHWIVGAKPAAQPEDIPRNE